MTTMTTNLEPAGNQPRSCRLLGSSRPRLALACLALLLLATSGTAIAAIVKVDVGHDEFVPTNTIVHAGDTVEWTWVTDHTSSVTSGNIRKPDGLFDSGIQLRPFSFSFTFQNPGTFPYYCRIDPD